MEKARLVSFDVTPRARRTEGTRSVQSENIQPAALRSSQKACSINEISYHVRRSDRAIVRSTLPVSSRQLFYLSCSYARGEGPRPEFCYCGHSFSSRFVFYSLRFSVPLPLHDSLPLASRPHFSGGFLFLPRPTSVLLSLRHSLLHRRQSPTTTTGRGDYLWRLRDRDVTLPSSYSSHCSFFFLW